jgi:hypothetical protein
MTERTAWTASVLWLLVSFLCLILPIFVPSSPNPSDYLIDPISISTGVMAILSFPASLLSLLFSPLIDSLFGIDPNSLQGMYLNVKLMFVLGLAQWFWAFPRLLDRSVRERRLALESTDTAALPEHGPADVRQFFSEDPKTPVERVMVDDDDREL